MQLQQLDWDGERVDMLIVSDWLDRFPTSVPEPGVRDAWARLHCFWSHVTAGWRDEPEFMDVRRPRGLLQRALNYRAIVPQLDALVIRGSDDQFQRMSSASYECIEEWSATSSLIESDHCDRAASHQ